MLSFFICLDLELYFFSSIDCPFNIKIMSLKRKKISQPMQPTNQNQLPLNYYISVYLSTGCLPDLIVRTSCMFNFYLTEKIKMSVFIQLLIRGLNFFSISTIQLVRESSSLSPLEFFECIICRFYIHKTFFSFFTPFQRTLLLGKYTFFF